MKNKNQSDEIGSCRNLREENQEKKMDHPPNNTEISNERLKPFASFGEGSNIFTPSFLSAGNPS